MQEWQKQFTEKMESLRGQYTGKFKEISYQLLEPAYQRLAEFVKGWEMKASSPQVQQDMRSFKFALTEDGYVLMFFRLKGILEVQCDYECWVPGSSRMVGQCPSIELSAINQEWVESCFQTCLDELVTRFSAAGSRREEPEPVGA